MLKKLIQISLVAVLAFGLTSCIKKDDDTKTSVSTSLTDQSASDEYDKAMTIVDSLASRRGSARIDAADLPCGVIKDTVIDGKHTIKFGDKTPCGHRQLSGTITYKLVNGANWGEVGAKLEVTFVDYKVLVLATNESVILNGTHIVENVSGKYLWQLFTTKNTVINHKANGGLEVSFIDSKGITIKRSRRIHQDRKWTRGNGDFTTFKFEVKGDSANVIENGTTKDGYPYVNTVKETFTWQNYAANSLFAVLIKGSSETVVTNTKVASATGTIVVTAGYKKTLTEETLVQDQTSNAYQIVYNIKFPGYDKTTTSYQLY